MEYTLELKCSYPENASCEKYFRLNGVQYVFRFENGYGASVIKHDWSYGHNEDLWEVAVMKDVGNGEMELRDNTVITNDVLPSLEDWEVGNVLIDISHLNPDGKLPDGYERAFYWQPIKFPIPCEEEDEGEAVD